MRESSARPSSVCEQQQKEKCDGEARSIPPRSDYNDERVDGLLTFNSGLYQPFVHTGGQAQGGTVTMTDVMTYDEIMAKPGYQSLSLPTPPSSSSNLILN